jgi:RimJ/RimL family protein N-acetyltransferase
VVEKATGAPVGICGLVRREGLPGVDVGFAFLPAAWGRGYATESARAAIALGRDAHGLEHVLAITSPDNDASIRVLERLGFSRERTLRMPGEDRETVLFARDLRGAAPRGAS